MEQLNDRALAKLTEIVKKELPSLTEADKVFLRARQAYLNRRQLRTFGSVLKAKPQVEAEKADTRPSYRQLQKQAKALGYPYVGVSREDLEVSISTGVGPQDA